MTMNEEATPATRAAKQAIGAENELREQIKMAINSAFGDKVVSNVSIELTGIGIKFEVAGHWDLPKDLWFKPSSQSS
jgi:hypothetical protein